MRSLCTSTFLLLISQSTVALASSSHPACQPSAEVAAVLDRAAAMSADCGEGAGCWDRRRALLERALADHPGDLHLHRGYQDLFLHSHLPKARSLLAEVRERYAALADANPTSAAYLYLLGRAAGGGKEARAAFGSAVGRDPDFPWSHLGLASSYARSRASGGPPAAAGRHLRRFMELCPWRFEGLAYAHLLDDDAFLRQRLARLREDPARLTPDHYRQIWRLEFHLEPPENHPAVREQVRADLEHLTSLGDSTPPAALRTLLEGHELIGDSEAIARLEAELERRDPCADDAVQLRIKSWKEENPRPARDAPRDELQGWGRRHDDVSREWIEQCPESFELRLERFMAVSGLETSSENEILETADAWLALWEANVSPIRMSPSPPALVARVLLKRDTGLDRIPDLLERARAELDREYETQASMADMPEAARRQMDLMHHSGVNDVRGLLAEAYLKLGRVEDIDPILLEMRMDLAEHFADTSVELGEFLRDDLAYSIARLDALLAEQSGRTLDAIVYHHRAASLTEHADKHVERAMELWRELGGTDAGWQALIETGGGSVASRSGWRSVHEPLEPFELPDANGSTWRLADLAGKTVFANLWATWCGPCHKELPFVQILHERLADRDDVAVITFNMDRHIGLVAPFLDKNGYTFPVLLASDYLRGDRRPMSIPRNWIVGGDGTLLREQIGFRGDPTPEEFVEDALNAMHEAESSRQR